MKRLRGWIALWRWRWATRGMTVEQRSDLVRRWLDDLLGDDILEPKHILMEFGCEEPDCTYARFPSHYHSRRLLS